MLRAIRGVCALVAAAVVAAPALAADGGTGTARIKPGVVLGPDTWQQAEGLLPPEILKHYKDGGYVNPVVEWADGAYLTPPDFLEGSQKNEGKFDIGAHGQVIEKSTGQQPVYLIGFPFPTIDSKDPHAASKILWNFFYRTWYFGNSLNQSQVNWVNAKALERRTDVEASFLYFDGVPEYERQANPQNFSNQFLTVVKSPSDLNGTASLSWRYLDPGKRDSSWAFVPALRRVRQVSPANRSDGFLGSDMSQDDGPFFDGKPEDFTWTLKEEVDQLRLVDPIGLRGDFNARWIPTGGWRADWPDIPFIGYMNPQWKGVAWAPATGALANRPHYVIEGRPKDKYYLYGRLELYLDKATFQGSWSRKFSWKDELLMTYQVMGFFPKKVTRPDGKVDYIQGSNMAFQCAENIKRTQATVAGIKSSPTSNFDGHITFAPTFFDMNSLMRHGK